jgi:hypothetical protein
MIIDNKQFIGKTIESIDLYNDLTSFIEIEFTDGTKLLLEAEEGEPNTYGQSPYAMISVSFSMK